MYNFRAFHHFSIARIFVFVVKHQEVIKVYVSMYISMLGIGIESYGHVLGPLEFLFNSEKIKISAIFRPFLMV